MAGCTSFLNVESLGKSTIEGFFSDIDGLTAAGLGLHRVLGELYDDDYIRIGELAGDNLYLYRINASQPLQLVYDYESTPADNSGYPYYFWKHAYEVCTNANNILYYGEKLFKEYPAQADVINKHFGYAHFARALSIFNLCNVYAMPYDYTPDASHPGVVAIDFVPGFDTELPRNTVKECYDLVLSDLNKAIDYLGDSNSDNNTYINALACKALLARVYLYMKDYDKAAAYAKEVMDKVSLTQRSDYVNMFRRAQDYPGEGIFRINTYDAGSGMRTMCTPLNTQNCGPDETFVASFSNDDIRKELFNYVAEKEDGDEFYGQQFSAICKYLPLKGGETKEENRRCDYFVLRVSEMYLIHAEALCLGGGDLNAAAADIKALRARALGKNTSEIELSYGNAEALDKIVQEERNKELCFEGHRFFDLKRRHEDIVRPATSSSTLKKLSYPDYRYCLPIAQMEMQSNDYMTQNDGYEQE